METPRGWKTWPTCTQTLKPSYSAPFISLWCVSKGQLSVVMILSDTEWRDTGRRIKVLDCLWLEAFRRTIINVTRKDKPGNNWHTLLESSGTQTIVKQHEKIMQMWKRSNFGLPCLSSVGVCRVILAVFSALARGTNDPEKVMLKLSSAVKEQERKWTVVTWPGRGGYNTATATVAHRCCNLRRCHKVSNPESVGRFTA